MRVVGDGVMPGGEAVYVYMLVLGDGGNAWS